MNNNKWFLNGGRESGRSFRLLCETYENKIAELEKENAELKKRVDNLYNSDCWASEQLTKSKELLERFLNVGDLWEFDGNAFLKLQRDVTQFLKYSEVEK